MSSAHGAIVLDVRHLRALQAIRDRGSLTRAARDLHLTQSALSHLLADLERQLGMPLLDRAGRPMAFTAAGRRVLAAADVVMPELAQTAEDLARLARGTAGRLLLSLECHSCFDWLVPTLDAYRAQWPEVDLDLRVGASFDPLPALRDRMIDAIITSERAGGPGVIAEPLFRYQIVAVLPPRHPLAARKRLTPADFADATMVTYPVALERLDVFSRFLVPAGIAPTARRTAELTAMIVQIVASGHGVAALPHWAVAEAEARGQVVCRPLGGGGLWSDLHVLRRGEDAATRHLVAFAELARTVSFRTLAGIVRVGARRG